jgi:immune inhibitor A
MIVDSPNRRSILINYKVNIPCDIQNIRFLLHTLYYMAIHRFKVPIVPYPFSNNPAPPPPMANPTQSPFSPSHYHRITNVANPSNPTLDIVNDFGPQNSTGLLKLFREGYYSGQYWAFTPAPAPSSPTPSNNTYRLRTWWLGPNRQLDVYAADTSKAVLRREDDTPHALDWRVGEWGDGTWWLGNEASGVMKVMDVGGTDGREVVLREKDEGVKTQRWRIEVIREINEGGGPC